MSDHSLLSPSSAERWLKCPASMQYYSPDGVPTPSTIFADEGSLMHEVHAACLRQNKNADVFIGQDGLYKERPDLVFTEEFAEAVQLSLDWIRSHVTEYKDSIRKALVEHKFKVLDLLGISGTTDLSICRPPAIDVIDLKGGKGVIVPARGNHQLLLYALGAYRYYVEVMGGSRLDIEYFDLRIIQPRTPDPVRLWQVSTQELIAFVDERLVPQGKRAYEIATGGTIEESDYGPDPEGPCRWCAGKGTCSAFARYALTRVEQVFQKFKMPSGVPTLELDKLPDKRLATLADIASWLPWLNPLKEWADAVYAYAQARAEEGEEVPGYKLVEGRSNRKWAKSEEETAAELAGMGIKPWKQALITLTEAEKLLKKPDREQLKPLWIKPPGNPLLVPNSDKREPIASGQSAEHVMSEFALATGGSVIDTPDTRMTATEVLARNEALKDFQLQVIEEPPPGRVTATEVLPQATDRPNLVVVQRPQSAMARLAATGGKPAPAAIGKTYAAFTYEPEEGQKQTPPRAGSMRRIIFDAGFKGNGHAADVLEQTGVTVSQLNTHLKYIAEKDGYWVSMNSEGVYVVSNKPFEKEEVQ